MMKLMICAMATAAVSLFHSLFTEKVTQAPSISGNTMNAVIYSISNFTQKGERFCMVAQTESNVTYQAFCSTDRVEWHRHGAPFKGNGSLRAIAFDPKTTDAPTTMFVKVKAL